MRNRHWNETGGQVKGPSISCVAGGAGLDNVALICHHIGLPCTFPPEINSATQP